MVHEITIPDTPELYTRLSGSGPRLLMIHGAGVDSSFFDSAAELLSEKYEVLTYDRRGYGKSGKSETDDYSVKAQADDVERMISYFHWNKTPFYVFGHSAGGHVTLELATRHPEWFSKIVLLEPPLFSCLEPDDPVYRKLEAMDAAMAKHHRISAMTTCISMESFEKDAVPLSEREEENYFDNMEQLVNFERQHAYTGEFNFDVLRPLDISVGLGKNSMDTYHARSAPAFCEKADATLYTFPGGHNYPREHPEDFAKLLEGFYE